MHLSSTKLFGALLVVAGFTSTASAHSIHRRGAQQHHKDLAERMAQPTAETAEGEAANFYARALTDAHASRYRITRRDSSKKPGQKKVIRKRADGAVCRIRPSAEAATTTAESSSSSSVAATESASSTPAATPTDVNNWWAETTPAASSSESAWSSSSAPWVEATSSSWVEPSSSSSSAAAPVATASTPHSGGGTSIDQVTNNVLLEIPESACGPCDATHEFPNGSEDWINCNMKSPSGWNPPYVSMDQLRVGDATSLKKQYRECSQDLLNLMTQVSHETSVPAQLLLSIAIRESACNVNARGGGGEVGLMQVAANRCPNGDIGSCHQPYNNIKLGADILKEKLADSNGNILEALGKYNGWMPGMTFDGAHNGPICQMSRNRDYVHSIVNGFMQGVDASGWNAWGQNGC